jgi:Rps23 Pro-64 3,4-dihydroxylase Tpa1-like proline 4-hydroxylase
MENDFFELTQLFVDAEIERLVERVQEQPRDGKLLRALINAYRKKGDLANALTQLERLKLLSKSYTQYYRCLHAIISSDKAIFHKRGMSPVPYKLFHDVLDEKFTSSLWGELERKQALFTSSELYSADGDVVDKEVRDSLCLSRKSMGDIQESFLEIVKSYFTKVELFFCRSGLNLYPRELELNLYRQGVGFKLHTDTGTEASIKTREISFIYYFFQEPKNFIGGDLVLFDTNRRSGECGDKFTKINIENNSLLFFPSDCWHQVTSLKESGASFFSGRFTLNGWLHSKKL